MIHVKIAENDPMEERRKKCHRREEKRVAIDDREDQAQRKRDRVAHDSATNEKRTTPRKYTPQNQNKEKKWRCNVKDKPSAKKYITDKERSKGSKDKRGERFHE